MFLSSFMVNVCTLKMNEKSNLRMVGTILLFCAAVAFSQGMDRHVCLKNLENNIDIYHKLVVKKNEINHPTKI